MPDHQPHRKTVHRTHTPGELHELTFSCYRRLKLLTNDDWRRRFCSHLDQALANQAYQLLAFVIMPEHIHLLVLPLEQVKSVSPFLSAVKTPFSREIKSVLVENNSRLLQQLTVRERPGVTRFRFWQEGGGYDRNLFSTEAILASIDYIHENPVRRKLCRRAIDWYWSSARYHLLQPPGQMFEGLPKLSPVPFEVMLRTSERNT